jgi:hypothetical protein
MVILIKETFNFLYVLLRGNYGLKQKTVYSSKTCYVLLYKAENQTLIC